MKKIAAIILLALSTFAFAQSVTDEQALAKFYYADVASYRKDGSNKTPEKKLKDYFLRRTMFVNSKDGLRVRNSPTLSSKTVTMLPHTSVVEVLALEDIATIDGIKAPWVRIRIPASLRKNLDDTEGYVFGGYLSEDKSGTKRIISVKNLYGKDFAEVKRAAEYGYAVAQYKLAEYYKLGLGCEKDAVKAVEWYKKAAEQDEPMAFDMLSFITKGASEAYEYSARAKAHGQGYWDDMMSAWDYGWDLENSFILATYIEPNGYTARGLSDKDCIIAYMECIIENPGRRQYDGIPYLMEAARNGNADAQLFLAYFDEYAENYGYKIDRDKWREMASRQGREKYDEKHNYLLIMDDSVWDSYQYVGRNKIDGWIREYLSKPY